MSTTSSQTTISEVAVHAGVSRQTVSNTLNAPQRVADHTLERVLQAIDELNYVPNRSAQSLRTRSSRLFGLRVDPAIEGTVGPFMDRFLHALTTAAGLRDHHLLLFSPTDRDELSGYDELLRSTSVDAFVLVDTHRDDPRVGALLAKDAVFVAFGRPWGDLHAEHSWVDVDGAAGTDAATTHLIDAGWNDIAFLGWPLGSDTGNDRIAGWRRALARAGRPIDDHHAAVSTDTVGPATVAAATLLDTGHDAIVCASDTLAVGVYRAARERGLEVGQDVAVIGFDDSPVAKLLDPMLATVRQPLEDVAERLVEMLSALLAGTPPPSSVALTPTLVVRPSATIPHAPHKETQR